MSKMKALQTSIEEDSELYQAIVNQKAKEEALGLGTSWSSLFRRALVAYFLPEKPPLTSETS